LIFEVFTLYTTHILAVFYYVHGAHPCRFQCCTWHTVGPCSGGVFWLLFTARKPAMYSILHGLVERRLQAPPRSGPKLFVLRENFAKSILISLDSFQITTKSFLELLPTLGWD